MKKIYEMPEVDIHEVNAAAFCDFVSVTDDEGVADVKVEELDAKIWED